MVSRIRNLLAGNNHSPLFCHAVRRWFSTLLLSTFVLNGLLELPEKGGDEGLPLALQVAASAPDPNPKPKPVVPADDTDCGDGRFVITKHLHSLCRSLS